MKENLKSEWLKILAMIVVLALLIIGIIVLKNSQKGEEENSAIDSSDALTMENEVEENIENNELENVVE